MAGFDGYGATSDVHMSLADVSLLKMSNDSHMNNAPPKKPDRRRWAYWRSYAFLFAATVCLVVLAFWDFDHPSHRSQSATSSKILVVGSSVAKGEGATKHNSWVDLTAAALKDCCVVRNAAVGGLNTAKTLEHVQTLKTPTPDVVVVALSLANEGLPKAKSAKECDEIAARFLVGLRAIADAARKRWGDASVVFGGVYPYGRAEHEGYDEHQLEALRRVDMAMKGVLNDPQWPEPVFHFLKAAGNERGRWKLGTASNPGHPNDRGFKNMFSAVDVQVLREKPEA